MKMSILILLFFCSAIAFGQDGKSKTYEITGVGVIEYPNEKTWIQVEGEATNAAIENALEKKFGQEFGAGSIQFIQNAGTDENPITNQSYSTIRQKQLKGDFIHLLKQECIEIVDTSYSKDSKKMIISKSCKCTVTILARAWTPTIPRFAAATLASEDKNSVTRSFLNNAPLYLYFKSTNSGWLTVYSFTGTKYQRLLPYHRMQGEYENGVRVEGDKEYIFFSKMFDYYGDKNKINRLYISTDKIQEVNRMVLIFSRKEITKPELTEGSGYLNPELNKDGVAFDYPKEINIKDFQKWITDIGQNEDISFKYIDLLLRNEDVLH